MRMKRDRTFISFFSGIEGFRLGLEASGWRCVHSVEIDPYCRGVQKARYGAEPEGRDIRKVRAKDLPHADLWVAGWPCQGLSVAGKRKGLADERSGLFWEFVRLLEQKRPAGFLAENVPGLLTTCSCSRCSTARCSVCGEKFQGWDGEGRCPECGADGVVEGVLPSHRGTDFFVVLTALQRLGYGVQTRILDAQYLGVPQRRRRVFFSGRIGAPCRPEVLFEPQGGARHSATGGEAGKISAGELARSLGGVGGGQDYGANKGTLVRPEVATSVTASAGHHGHSSPRGDGSDNLVADKAATIGTSQKPDRGQRGENIIAGTLQSCSGDQGRKTPEVDHLVASTLQSPAGGLRTTDIQTLVQASSDKAHTVSKGTGGGLGGRDGQDDYVLIEGDSAASTPDLPRLRAGCGRGGEVSILRVDQTRSSPLIKSKTVTDSIATGTGHGGYANQAIVRAEPECFEPRVARNGRGAPGPLVPPLKAESGSTGEGDGAPCVVVPPVAAPLTAGSNPNSHAAGRRREDDQNLVAQKEATAFQSRYYTRGGKAGGKPSKTVEITNAKKRGDAAPLVQQPLFIHTADGGMNQSQVKEDGKADCLSEAQPGAVAIQEDKQNGVKVDPLAGSVRANAPGHQPGGSLVAFNWQADGKQGDLNSSTKGTGALSCKSTPAVAYNVKGMAHGGEKYAYETDKTGTVDTDGRNPSGNEAGTLVGPSPMSVRRLTPTECERLQGFPDGWTCTCKVRPDCPDRRVPPWLDPSTFTVNGCGHSACGCTCSDSPRYKSLGNAVATCAVAWIGGRLHQLFEKKVTG